MVRKAVIKSLLKNKKLLGAIALLFMMAMLLLSLSNIAFDNLWSSYDTYKTENNFEDFRLMTVNELEDQDVYTKERERQLEEKYEINMEKNEYYRFEKEDEYKLDIYPYNSDNEINVPTVEKGKLPENNQEIFLTKAVFEGQGFKIGDEITIDDKDYEIVGYGYMPQYTLAVDFLGGDMMPTPTKYGGAYITENDFDKISMPKKDHIGYYSVTTQLEQSARSEEKLREKIKKDQTLTIPILDEYGKPQMGENGKMKTTEIPIFPLVFDDEVNLPLTGMEHDMEGAESMFSFLAFIIVVLTIALAVVLFNSIFKAQRREMGILKAEGVKNSTLARYFIVGLVVILVLSGLIGLALGTFASKGFVQLFLSYYSLPLLEVDSAVFISAFKQIGVALVIIVAAVYFFSVRKNLNTPALILIKDLDTDKPPRINIAKYTKRLSFKTKYMINILIRNISKTLLLTFGVLISAFLLLMGAVMLSGMNNIVNNLYGETYTYDYQVVYSEDYQPEKTDDSIISINANVENSTSNVDIDDKKINLYGFDPKSEYFNLTDENGDTIPAEKYENGIVVSAALQKSLNLQVGDLITVENPYNVDEEVEFEVTEISNDQMSINAYVDLDYLQEKLSVKSSFVNGEVGSGNIEDEVYENDENAVYFESLEAQEDLQEQMKVIYGMIGMIAVIAGIIGVITLITISALVISSNKKTISVMKVLGYTNKEIKKMITAPYKWIVIIVYFAAIPLIESAIQSAINVAMDGMDFAIVVNIDFKYALGGFIIIYLIYIISMRISYRSIKKIKLSEALKTSD